MKQRQTTFLVIGGALLFSLLLYAAWSANKGTKHYTWFESYDAFRDDQPYGTLFLKKLLEEYRPGGEFTFNETKSLDKLLPGAAPGTDYIFVGPSVYLTEEEQTALLEFIENGNDALIASNNFPHELTGHLYADSCSGKGNVASYDDYKSVSINFFHPALKKDKGYVYARRSGEKDMEYPWGSTALQTTCDPDGATTPLGFQDPGGINFLRVPHGKGFLYLHTNPIVFTNFFLKDSDKLDYAAGVFGHLRGKNIILDEYSKVPFSRTGKDHYDSPLYFILQQPALKYAWWLLLATAALYMIFAGKRMQRVIPVREKKANTSLEFVHLVSTLYFNNGNPLDMARKKMRYFLYLLRSRYGVQSSVLSEEQMVLLSEKSKVSLPEIKIVFDQYANIEQGAYYNTQTDKLMGLYNAIENFRQKCK